MVRIQPATASLLGDVAQAWGRILMAVSHRGNAEVHMIDGTIVRTHQHPHVSGIATMKTLVVPAAD